MLGTAILAFVMLFVTVAPLRGALDVLRAGGLTPRRSRVRQLTLRASVTGFLILLAFALGGIAF